MECDPSSGWACSNADEYGLQSAMSGLKYMLNGNSPPAHQIRAGAEVVTIFLTDDRAYSLDEEGKPIAPYVNFFPDRTTVYALTGEDNNDCGLGEPLGIGYRQIARLTGGKSASICSPNLGDILDDIIYTAAGTQSYRLSKTPISNSLSVYVDGNFIPRDSDQGFVYFPTRNGIAFFGSYRPSRPKGSEYAPEYIVVAYKYFVDRCKESDRGANNCAGD